MIPPHTTQPFCGLYSRAGQGWGRNRGLPLIDALAASGEKALTAIRAVQAEVRGRVWRSAAKRLMRAGR